jgi:hypothetical protein
MVIMELIHTLKAYLLFELRKKPFKVQQVINFN